MMAGCRSIAIVVLTLGCVEGPELTFDNPCDPRTVGIYARCGTGADIGAPATGLDRGLDGVEFGDGICSDLLDCGLGCLDEMRDAPTCIDACRAEADREANVLFDDWRACVNEANCADPTDCGGCDQVEASCRSDRPSARRTSPDEP